MPHRCGVLSSCESKQLSMEIKILKHFVDRSELAKLELSVDRNVLGGPPRVWNGAIKLKDLIPEAGAE
jgi:hypothetical protein